MKLDYILRQPPVVQVHTIPVTLSNFCSVTVHSLSLSDRMVFSDHNYFCWSHLAPPSALYPYKKLRVGWRIYSHCCSLSPNKTPPWKLYLAILDNNLPSVHSPNHPNLLLVAWCLPYTSSSTTDFHLHKSYESFQPTVTECIQHSQLMSHVASSRKSPNCQQPPAFKFNCLSQSWAEWFFPGIIDQCFVSRHRGTQPFFHFLREVKLGCLILSAICFKQNSVYFKLINAVPSALQIFNESLLSSGAFYS